MLTTISPNRVLLLAVAAFVFYWILALFFPGPVLRDVFNSLRLSAAIILTITWAKPAWTAAREEARSGEWQLVVAIFFLWFVVTLLGAYSIVFNWYGRPASWAESAIAGFFPYSFLIAAVLFIVAPGVHSDGVGSKTVWTLILGTAIGAFIAGMLTMASISTG